MESSRVLSYDVVQARRPHTCTWCGGRIYPRARCTVVREARGGSATTVYGCLPCARRLYGVVMHPQPRQLGLGLALHHPVVAVGDFVVMISGSATVVASQAEADHLTGNPNITYVWHQTWP